MASSRVIVTLRSGEEEPLYHEDDLGFKKIDLYITAGKTTDHYFLRHDIWV